MVTESLITNMYTLLNTYSFDTINVGHGNFNVHVLNVFDCLCVSALSC